MIVLMRVWWIAPLLAVLGASVVLTLMIRKRRSPGVAGAALEARVSGSDPTTVPAADRQIVRFDLHLFFAEPRDTLLVVDGLADIADSRGALCGVPVSLTLARPTSRLAEEVLLGSIADATRDGHCQIELDFAQERTTMTLVPPGRKVTIPVEAASGLPVAY